MSDRINIPGFVLSAIVARSQNGVIGREGDMPWRLSDDLKRFKALTLGKPIIMGRKTWESFPKRPLPKRPNIVISRNTSFVAANAYQVSRLSVAIAVAQAKLTETAQNEAFIIGGGQIYEAAMPFIQRLYITEVLAEIDGDTFFPEIAPNEWREIESLDLPPDEKNSHATRFRILERLPAG